MPLTATGEAGAEKRILSRSPGMQIGMSPTGTLGPQTVADCGCEGIKAEDRAFSGMLGSTNSSVICQVPEPVELLANYG